MGATRRLEVIIAGDAKGAGDAFDDTERRAGSFGERVGGVLGKAALAVGAAAGAAVVGVGWALKGAFEAAEESAKISRETERVIRTTGGAAHVTADQVGELAGSISDLTGVDDELIQSGANLLLTFTNIHNAAGKGNDIFNQATRLALDMSTALGTDMSDASIQLGKALNDPIKGITALSRSGVSFTEQQKEQIKTLVKSGDILGAQKIILGELSKEFGGAAAAAGTPLDKLKVKLGNFQEEVGAKLIPVVAAVVDWLGQRLPPVFELVDGVVSEFAGGMQAFLAAWENADDGITSSGFAGAMEQVAITARHTWDWLPNVTNWLGDHKEILYAVALAVGVGLVAAMVAYTGSAIAAGIATLAAFWPLLLVVAVVAALAAGVMYLWNNFDTFHNVVSGVVAWLQANVPPIFETIKNVVIGLYEKAMAPLIGYIQENREAFANLGKVLLVVVAVALGIVAAAIAAVIAVAFIVVFVAQLIIVGIVALVAVLYNAAQALWDFFNIGRDALGNTLDAFENFIQGIWDVVQNVASGLGTIASWFYGLPLTIWNALKDLGGMLWNLGAKAMEGLIDGIWSRVVWVRDNIWRLLQWIRNLFPFSPAKEGPFSGKGWVTYSGAAISEGLAEGMVAHIGAVEGAANSVVTAAHAPIVGGALVGATQGPAAGASESSIVVNVNGFVGNEDELGRAVARSLTAAERRGSPMPWATAGAR